MGALHVDGESPVNFRNISGLAPLDDTVNMSVVIRVKYPSKCKENN